ncbi:MAG: hypothetical protein LBN43_04960 [Oscillospiraceae bacterium]|jgi:formate C-acetyltransferase|nr:hypothetical protein [Oscillospiraceae bacterium]
MAFKISEITPRVRRLTDRSRDAVPHVDAERTRLLTEYYQSAPNEVPIVKRAKGLYEILTKMSVHVDPDELIVGNVGAGLYGVAVYPETGALSWLKQEFENGKFDNRVLQEGPMTCDAEDREYIKSVEPWWRENGLASKIKDAFPEESLPVVAANAIPHNPNMAGVHGHFIAGYRRACEYGFGQIKKDAQAKIDEIMRSTDVKLIEKYHFYKSIVISCDAIIIFTKRFSAECSKLAAVEKDSVRKAELEQMADSLGHIMENPCRTYWEAMQVIYLYHLVLKNDLHVLGLAPGRVDQIVGDYLDADLKAGRVDLVKAQEIADCFAIKVGDLFLCNNAGGVKYFGVKADNQRISLFGVKADGSDATNTASYIILQTARLLRHDPNFSIFLHEKLPDEAWEASLEMSKYATGVFAFENTELVVEAMTKRGIKIEDARNVATIGCTEWSPQEDAFMNVSGIMSRTHFNPTKIMLLAMNNGEVESMPFGFDPMNPPPLDKMPKPVIVQAGVPTGYLYDFKTFDEVLAAFKKQFEYFMDWWFRLNSIIEMYCNPLMVVPVASATSPTCMEKGVDMMLGGCKYNGYGSACIGIATAIDSLIAIKHFCFDTKQLTTREFYDIVIKDQWKGHEALRVQAKNEPVYYGNDNADSDAVAKFVSDVYTTRLNSFVGERGTYSAGAYSAGAHQMMGEMLPATFNGRGAGEAVADGASCTQGIDRGGPTSMLNSICALNPSNYYNGLQFVTRISPSSVEGEAGTLKLKALLEGFIENGGGQVQYNVVSSDQLRDAQVNPDKYKNLSIKVAGYSAYFVELNRTVQDEIISRTDHIA